MMKKMKMNLRQRLCTALAALICFLFAFPFFGGANLHLSTASASEEYLEIQSYNVVMTIGRDRQVRVDNYMCIKKSVAE